MLKVWLKRIGDEIRNRRTAMGYDQEAFGALVKLHRNQLGAMERGSRSYTIGPLIEVLAGVDNDPVKSLLDMVSGINSIDAQTIEMCRKFLLLNEDGRKIVSGMVQSLLKLPPEDTSHKHSPRKL